jgi:hypothetical protein
MGLLFIILTIFIALVFDYTHGRSPGGDRSYRLGLGLYDSGRRFNDGLFFLFGLGRLNSKTIL